MKLSTAAILLCIACQFVLALGQIFLKHGMEGLELTPRPTRRIARGITLGIVFLSLWFFLWLGLLQWWDLSHLYPFEGLGPVIVVAGAAAFLHERVTLTGWIGVALISSGVALVAGS